MSNFILVSLSEAKSSPFSCKQVQAFFTKQIGQYPFLRCACAYSRIIIAFRIDITGSGKRVFKWMLATLVNVYPSAEVLFPWVRGRPPDRLREEHSVSAVNDQYLNGYRMLKNVENQILSTRSCKRRMHCQAVTKPPGILLDAAYGRMYSLWIEPSGRWSKPRRLVADDRKQPRLQ